MPKKGEDVEGEPVELELDEQLRRSASTEQSGSPWVPTSYKTIKQPSRNTTTSSYMVIRSSEAITDKMSCTHIDEYLANLKPPTNGQQVHK
jgi:hypothetical protein